jgi:hypothetical protein
MELPADEEQAQPAVFSDAAGRTVQLQTSPPAQMIVIVSRVSMMCLPRLRVIVNV